MSIEIIVAFISLLGLCVTAILGSIGYFYKVRMEEKKSGRKVLYFLLETRHAIRTTLFNPSEMTEQYINACIEKLRARGLPFESDKSTEESLFPLIHSLFSNLADAAKTDIEHKLLEPLNQSLLEFATVNPVLAYKLTGKEKLQKFASQLIEYSHSAELALQKLPDYEKVMEKVSSVTKKTHDENLIEIFTTLDEDIKNLARYCGRRDFKESLSVLHMKYEPASAIDFSELDDFIDSFLKSLRYFY
jgi:hypothetical protein